MTGGMSNGRLLAMEPQERTETIAGLSEVVRRKLANIAALGCSHYIRQSVMLRENGREVHAGARLTDARKLADLGALLLAEERAS